MPDDMIVGLDIGTSFIRVAVGETDVEGKLEITGTAEVKSEGLRNGIIVNIEAAKDAIKNAIETAQSSTGNIIQSVVTAIGGEQIESENSKGVIPVHNNGENNREITKDDILQVIKNAAAVVIPEDREKLHVVPQQFIVDGLEGIREEPLHRIGTRLEVKVHIITVSKTIVQNLKSCIARAGYLLDTVMLKTLAQMRSVCHDDELELGSIIIDLGAGSTDVLVLLNGAPVGTASIKIAGNTVTNDVAVVAKIPLKEAERIKVESGCCYLEGIKNDSEVILPGVGGRAPEIIRRSELCEIIQARMEDIFECVKVAIKKNTNGAIKHLSGNIILTGGGANMEGVVELAQNVFKTSSVRIGIPESLGGIEEQYRKPEFATAVGLVVEQNIRNQKREVSRKKKNVRLQKNNSEEKDGVLKKLKKFFF